MSQPKWKSLCRCQWRAGENSLQLIQQSSHYFIKMAKYNVFLFNHWSYASPWARFLTPNINKSVFQNTFVKLTPFFVGLHNTLHHKCIVIYYLAAVFQRMTCIESGLDLVLELTRLWLHNNNWLMIHHFKASCVCSCSVIDTSPHPSLSPLRDKGLEWVSWVTSHWALPLFKQTHCETSDGLCWKSIFYVMHNLKQGTQTFGPFVYLIDGSYFFRTAYKTH